MQLFDRHRKGRVGFIVNTDTVEYKKAGGYGPYALGPRTLAVIQIAFDLKPRASHVIGAGRSARTTERPLPRCRWVACSSVAKPSSSCYLTVIPSRLDGSPQGRSPLDSEGPRRRPQRTSARWRRPPWPERVDQAIRRTDRALGKRRSPRPAGRHKPRKS
jgi:hypothetical protein